MRVAFYRHAFCRWCRAICVLPPDQFNELTDIDTRARRAPRTARRIGFCRRVFGCLHRAGCRAAAVNPVLLTHQDILAQVAGGFIIILGLHVGGLGPCRFWVAKPACWTLPSGASGAPTASLFAAFFMGAAFALAGHRHRANSSHHSGTGRRPRQPWRRGWPFDIIRRSGSAISAGGTGCQRFLLVSAAVKKHMKWVERSAGVLLAARGSSSCWARYKALPPICSTGFRHWVNWVKFVLVMMRHFQNIPPGRFSGRFGANSICRRRFWFGCRNCKTSHLPFRRWYFFTPR